MNFMGGYDMPNLINLTEQRFGRLTVLYRAPNRGKKVCWHCRCDCGNEKDIPAASLRSGKSQSCGCLRIERVKQALHQRIIHEINVGERYGHLVVTSVNGDNTVTCLCDCGNTTTVRRDHLYTNNTTNCGCRNWPKISRGNFKNEIGNKYGHLTVLEEVPKQGRRKCVIWRCRCDCGNIKEIPSTWLRQGAVFSCGCLKSRGELKLKTLFTSLGIEYESQKHFNNLKNDITGYYLYFDFYLPAYNTLIEYQGEQHFMSSGTQGWASPKKTQDLQRRDQMKRDYCQKHNIKLIEIPYNDFDILDENYILNILEANNENSSH